MIHSLADYSSDNKKNIPNKNSASKPLTFNHNKNKIQAHKSLGKYPLPKNNNINSNFKAFKGRGKAVSVVKTEGLKINKFVQNKTNKNKEIIKINIRLFNGNVIAANFNSDQTLRDIKNFVEKKTECHNFSLVEGFPPKVLNNFTATIEQLNIKNSLITQKLK